MVWKWFGFCELRKVARFAAEIFMRSLFLNCASEFWKSGCNLFHGFNRIIFIYLYGFGYQNPEKYVSIFRLEKHTSGAKAPAVLLDLLPGINPRPTSCAFVQSIDLLPGINPRPTSCAFVQSIDLLPGINPRPTSCAFVQSIDLLPGINPRPTSCAFVQSIVRKRERPEPVKVRAVAFLLPIMSVSQNPLIACKL